MNLSGHGTCLLRLQRAALDLHDAGAAAPAQPAGRLDSFEFREAGEGTEAAVPQSQPRFPTRRGSATDCQQEHHPRATQEAVRSLEQRAIVVKIGLVEIRKQHKRFEIMNLDPSVLEGDQPLLAQFAQDTVDMDGAQSQCVSQQVL